MTVYCQLFVADLTVGVVCCAQSGYKSFRRTPEYGELETMKIATFRLPHERPDKPGATFAAVITETATDATGTEYATHAVQLEGISDVGAYLTLPPEDR